MEHDALTREDADRPSTCESDAADEASEAPGDGPEPDSGRPDEGTPASESGDDSENEWEPEPDSDPDADAADGSGERASDPDAAVEVPWTRGDEAPLPRRAVGAARSWVAAHQGITAGVVAVLIVAVVVGGFVYAFSRVLTKDRVVPRGERAVAEELRPVENAELPHLGMRVTSISTAAAPNVTVNMHLDPPAGEALPQLAQESFALTESTGEGDPASVAATGFSYDAATGSCTIAYAMSVADPAARRTLSISLAPESGYRGSCSITYSCA